MRFLAANFFYFPQSHFNVVLDRVAYYEETSQYSMLRSKRLYKYGFVLWTSNEGALQRKTLETWWHNHRVFVADYCQEKIPFFYFSLIEEVSMKVGKDHSVYNCKGRGKKGEIIAFGNISYGCDDALLPPVFFTYVQAIGKRGFITFTSFS